MPKPSLNCNKCLLSDNIPGVEIEANDECNFCANHKPFKPFPKEELLIIFKKAKRKGRIYDALVPLSGGKDSTYVLYIAVKKYNLNVLTYTFDNGFMSDLAKTNIENSVKVCEVDHIWVKHDLNLINELYRTTLIQSGEICGICGIGIERSMLKISGAWKIPLIILGHSPTESNSFTSENIYDQQRLRSILAKNPNITNDKINRFLIYPKLNFISSFIYTKLGRFGKKVNILYYEDLPSDKEIGEIIKKELRWLDSSHSDYTRHFDCLAEPFTNFIREKRFGYSRRLPQLSNMIRNNELTRKEALEIMNADCKLDVPDNYEFVKKKLDLTDNDIEEIGKVPLNEFSSELSSANMIFAKIRKIVKK